MKHLALLTSFALLLLLHSAVHGQTVVTIAGTGTSGYSGDGGQATAAKLSDPEGVAIDAAGNIYIADNGNNCIRKVDVAGTITTIAGNGTPGYTGDGAAATAAKLTAPTDVTTDAAGNIYIADYGNHCIRKINGSGIISTIAGTGTPGFSGDGLAATAATLDHPAAVAVDGAGNVYIADEYNHRIRKVTSAGIITTVAGSGSGGFGGDGTAATTAALYYPFGVFVDAAGNIIIGDYSNHRIRKVNTSGIISTIAGSATIGYGGDGGPATNAYLFYPMGVTEDGAGNLYIADNANGRIRMVDNAGIINTATGSSAPTDVTTDAKGNVYIADYGGNVVRRLDCALPSTGAITGPSSVCIGDTILLSDAVAGGVWSSSGTAATVTDSMVRGMSAGTITISYSLVNACGTSAATSLITVNGAPAVAPITGPGTVCEGKTMTVADATPAGTWSISNTNATLSGGFVTGVLAGTSIISYTVTDACGTSSASTVITIDPAPDAGTITGVDSVCPGAVIPLSATVPGGVWSSSNTTMATVDATGLVTGVATGLADISYSVTNSCGTASTFFLVMIGMVSCPTSVPSMAVAPGTFTIYPDPSDGVFTIALSSASNEPLNMVITNMTGKIVKEFQMSANKATDVTLHEPAGVYFLSGRTADGNYTGKIMICR